MNNKERYLKFIKDFNNIGITDILKDLNFNTAGFYTGRYSLDNMQKITDKMRQQIKAIYPDIKNEEFILDDKEKNVDFVKDIKEIYINKICKQLKIATSALYVYECSEAKYELVVAEIKRQLDEVYKKYSDQNNT